MARPAALRSNTAWPRTLGSGCHISPNITMAGRCLGGHNRPSTTATREVGPVPPRGGIEENDRLTAHAAKYPQKLAQFVYRSVVARKCGHEA